jgi:hypothetical protein
VLVVSFGKVPVQVVVWRLALVGVLLHPALVLVGLLLGMLVALMVQLLVGLVVAPHSV